MKILDCTLRDGGYYNNWKFDKKFVNNYLTAISDYVKPSETPVKKEKTDD